MHAHVVVLGGSVAGLSAALLLARDGHRVTVVERDRLDVGAPDDAWGAPRRGIPHYLQPHAFIPRGRAELRANLPDVYAALLEAGARDVDVRPKMPEGSDPADGDEELQYIAVRRPLIEWALRRAVRDQAGIEVHDATAVDGLVVDRGSVTGVRTAGATVTADLVVDALGRRSPTTTWLAAAGGSTEPPETSDCGVVYYSRYYRWRPSFQPPDGPWLLSPRGDLGYFGYASFPGDNHTFAALLSVPSGVAEWRCLGEVGPFEAAVAQIPALRSWVQPDEVEPLTDVMPMAGLRNTLQHDDPKRPVGLAPVGDAYSHTDPVLAHGLAFGLVHAAELARALRDHDDMGDACAAYAAATFPALQERYHWATALDDQRHRMWRGEAVDVAHHDGAYGLFSLVAAGVAATVDAEVFRMFVRRIGLLDSTKVLDGDIELQRRIEELFAKVRASAPPTSWPSRDEMLEIVEAARS